jgi:hypothetical protein
MKSTFDLNRGEWTIIWPGRVAKYDLVFHSPPEDPMQGIALGNGDVGALCWTQGSKLIIAVNKCDLWDDTTIRRWTDNDVTKAETGLSTLRHACRVEMDFHYPIFDLFYLTGCDGRLSIADGIMTLKVASALGKISLTARVDKRTGLLMVDVKKQFDDPVPVEVCLEHFGSRIFARWYSMQVREPSAGLAGTSSFATATVMGLTHPVTRGTFAVAATIAGTAATYQRRGPHQCTAVINGNAFSLRLAVTSPVKTAAVKLACDQLAAFSPALLRTHKAAWKTFWLRSFVETGDRYNDNFWHLAMYYLNACQGGRYPGRFIDGLWGWNRDFRAWGRYFHWNQQQLYWGLNAAGHHDLVRAYLEFRFAGLENAKLDCQEGFGVEGAFVADVTDQNGFNNDGLQHNHTPVTQIALEFWRQYQYTGDDDFLKNRAWPYLREAAQFFATRFEKLADGKYHAKTATSYEGWRLVRECTTEYACGRALFAAVLQAGTAANETCGHEDHWHDLLENLAGYVELELDESYIKDGKYTIGRFRDANVKHPKMLAAAVNDETGQTVVSRWPRKTPQTTGGEDIFNLLAKLENGLTPEMPDDIDSDGDDGAFPWSELAPVFPAGVVGLAEQGTELFRTLVTTTMIYSLDGTGWSPVPIVMARLGMAAELQAVLKEYAERWQIYPTGMTHWGVRNNIRAEAALRWRTSKVSDQAKWQECQKDPDQKIPASPSWPFRHSSLESLGVFTGAVNESLLQSHDGVIRIAPALGKTQSARFTLHAMGGVEVSAEIMGGKIQWVFVKGLANNTAKISNPWKKMVMCENGIAVGKATGRVVELAIKKGQTFLLVADEKTARRWQTIPETWLANQAPRHSPNGLTQLGLERSF